MSTSQKTGSIKLDVGKLQATQQSKFVSEVQKVAVPIVAGTKVTLDTSRLSDYQRDTLISKLKQVAQGVAPYGSGGSLVGAEYQHSSHNDTDGWF